MVGTFLKLPATETVDVAALAGFDFGIVDREHSQLGERDALRLVRHASAIGLPAVVRVAGLDQAAINRLLEAGAAGIQLSSVRTAGEVRGLVAATRYAPEGRRSVSLAHPSAGYGAVPLREAVRVEPPLLIGQIETAETDDPLDEIVAAGLDVVFIGVTDLTVDVEFDAERARRRVEEITKATEAAGLVLGAFAADAASIPGGTRYVALSSDLAMLREAAAGMVSDAG
jgi:4-hydroxy-2-oxoheptanedioate aldolase